MAATERDRHRPARRRRCARPGSCCRPKRAGTRTRPTGAFSCREGIVFGVRDDAAAWSRPQRCCPTPPAMPGSAWCWSPRAGAAAALPPSWSMPAWRRRTGADSRPGSTRRRTARPSMARSASRRRCSCAGCGWRIPAASGTARRHSDRRPRRHLIARDRQRHGISTATLCSRISPAVPARASWPTGDAMALVRDGRTARHIGPLFADNADAALALVDAIARSETRPAAARCRARRRPNSSRA